MKNVNIMIKTIRKNIKNYNLPILDKNINYILNINFDDKIDNIKNCDYILLKEIIKSFLYK